MIGLQFSKYLSGNYKEKPFSNFNSTYIILQNML